MDQRNRKLMTLHKALYPRDDRDRLYVSRKERGRELTSIEVYVDALTQGFKYIKRAKKKKKRLLRTASNNTSKITNRKTTKTRKQKWKGKQLYEYFKWLNGEIAYEKIWIWLKKRTLKRETESIFIVARNDIIRTNYIKANIDNTQQNINSICMNQNPS